MNLKELLAKAQKRAAELATHMKSRDLTDEEVTEVTALAAEIDGLKTRIKANNDAAALLGGVAVVTDSEDGASAQTPAGRKSLGQSFTTSDAYAGTFAKNANHGAPVKATSGRSAKATLLRIGTKAATGTVGSDAAFLLPQDLGFDDVTVAPQLSLLDLITLGQTTSNGIQYVQARMVTRGAAIVPESTDSTDAKFLKPKSTIEAVKVSAPVVTYADGIDITRQMMSDAPYLETMIDTELTYNLRAAIQDGLVNGDGEDDNPFGILHTTGVQSQLATDEDGVDLTGAGSGDIFATVRAAITKVTRLNGGLVNAVLLSPEDDERWDLARDNENRFIGAGPYGLGYNTAWGRPRVACEALPQGTFILGNFKTIAWMEREAISITANPQHKDYAARNLVYLLAESRGVQTIRRPAHLVVGKFNRAA